MSYLEVTFTFEPATPDNREIVAALLSQIGFDSFSDTSKGINAYIPHSQFDEQEMKDILIPLHEVLENFNYSMNRIAEQNWNETWEKSFEPIEIGTQCCIRAPFHPKDNDFTYDLIIEPKMSFGTGHHPTTVLMIEQILQIELHGKTVLDMGCGTGVLGILASKKGATKIVGIDVDDWAYTNSLENCQRNQINNFEVLKGNASSLVGRYFDVILANINRNILLNDMEIYVNSMNKGSQLVLSGFYTQDIPILSTRANQLGLSLTSHAENDNWAAVCFTRNA
ncbi:MAG: 50S ribosomal protein L11 methyltransferase [Salinivirgaceae bacterium]|nr:50S ribosomal protein L11 methyltransferase [Salinivirgaceae bacterium]